MNKYEYYSTKTYRSNIGLSTCFRQWRAESHCRYLHGYSLEIVLCFVTNKLDEKGWVVDFGSLKPLRKKLEDLFDHKTVVAVDDPDLYLFHKMREQGIIDLVIVPATGCEKFAELIFEMTENWLKEVNYAPRVQLNSVEVHEHSGNSAIVRKTS